MKYKAEMLFPDDEQELLDSEEMLRDSDHEFVLARVGDWFKHNDARIQANEKAKTEEKLRNEQATTLLKLLGTSIVLEAEDGRALYLTTKKNTSSSWKDAFEYLISAMETGIEKYEGDVMITKKAVIKLMKDRADKAKFLYTGNSETVDTAKMIDAIKVAGLQPDEKMEIIYRLTSGE